MKELAVFAVFLLSASTALADKGSVTIENQGNHPIEVKSYDWDDGVRAFEAAKGNAEVGQSVTVTCVKGLFQPDSPGCQIEIWDPNASGELISLTKRDNGAYIFSGTWDWEPCKYNPGNCVLNKDVSLDPH